MLVHCRQVRARCPSTALPYTPSSRRHETLKTRSRHRNLLSRYCCSRVTKLPHFFFFYFHHRQIIKSHCNVIRPRPRSKRKPHKRGSVRLHVFEFRYQSASEFRKLTSVKFRFRRRPHGGACVDSRSIDADVTNNRLFNPLTC